MFDIDNKVVEKWTPVLEGIEDDYKRRVSAQLLENQAKAIVSDQIDEANSFGTTTVGKLGTFQKFAFPLVRRVWPELIANNIISVQPMQGPVSQVFYMGATRQYGDSTGTTQDIYSKWNLTYRNLTAGALFSEGNIDLDLNTTGDVGHDLIGSGGTMSPDPEVNALASATVGGQIASWPDATKIYGIDVSSGEALQSTGIPEMNLHIEQQPVAARTRKMRALWTLEAQQDLKAYHNLDLEKELTDMLGKELRLEIDRELIEDVRMLAYDLIPSGAGNDFGGWNRAMLDRPNSNDFEDDGTGFTPAQYLYDYTTNKFGEGPVSGTLKNVFVIDFSSSALPFAPQHVGHVYSNLLAILNLASQDIYTSTHRGPGNWILCSPLMASLLESAAKLEGGLPSNSGPTTNQANKIQYKGKFAGKYDLYVDPLYPQDEIMMGYKGAGPMDAGYVYCPYIPLQQLPTIYDPDTFQPRKGILTRYGKLAIEPAARFYRIIRVVGPTANYLFTPFAQWGDGSNTVEGAGQ
jgi:hypothetical protein